MSVEPKFGVRRRTTTKLLNILKRGYPAKSLVISDSVVLQTGKIFRKPLDYGIKRRDLQAAV